MGWLIFRELKSAVKAQKCELAEVLKDDLKDSEHMGSKRFAKKKKKKKVCCDFYGFESKTVFILNEVGE